MILKLVQADWRSERFLILIASIVSVLLWLTEAGRFEPQSSILATFIYGQFPFLIFFGVMELRKLTQKRRRLLAQLPVTGNSVRISSWVTYFAVIAIACLISTVMLVFYPPAPMWGWRGFAAAGALMIAGFISLAALVRIAHLASSFRRPVRYIVLFGSLLVFVILYIQWSLFFDGQGPFRVDTIVQWERLLPAAVGTAFALIVADILLDRLADDRLH